MAIEETIEQARKLLVDATGGKAKVVLFGSHAREDAHPDSDLDLLVIEPSVDDRVAEMVRLRRALKPLAMPIDLIVVGEEHVEEWGHLRNTVIGEALWEGRVLHGAP